MELTDTHCHLTLEQLADNIEAVLARSVVADVTG
jgi:Tat protein secretion system quality control protein TatD with DNase activity